MTMTADHTQSTSPTTIPLGTRVIDATGRTGVLWASTHSHGYLAVKWDDLDAADPASYQYAPAVELTVVSQVAA